MNKLFTILFCTIISISFSQEKLIPLTINQELLSDDVYQTRSTNNLDSTFQDYTYTNLDIPVWDDFSVDKFVKYDQDFSAAGVSSTLYHMLMDETNTVALSGSIKLCDSIHSHADTVVINAGIIETNTTFFSTGFNILVNDLNTYPINGQLRKAYNECYITIDSIIDGVANTTQDTVWYNGIDFDPDYIQDSARVFFALKNDPDKIWVDNYACRNFRYAINPKSLGVATFDGVSNNGYPYQWGSINSYGDADVLTSKPINLAGKSNVYLSFFYQAKGLGNAPEVMDSLCLDVYSPSLDQWFESNLWSVPGDVTVDVWHQEQIPITQLSLLQDGFRFRFRNKATLSGVLDHWHIDYVNLRDNSTAADVIIDDIAIMEPIESFLIDYTAVPWDHYVNLANPNSVMKSTEGIRISNNHTTAKLQTQGGMLFNGTPHVLGVTTPNWSVGVNSYSIGVNSQSIVFPQTTTTPNKADFDVKVNVSTSSTNIYDVNDTTYFTQYFRNYYAYDDGSAENGYGLQNNNALLAYKFEAYEADSLKGILMKFIPTNENVTNEIFLLTIWKDNNGEPGDIIYQDDFFSPHFPIYSGQKNSYKYYTFNNGQSVPVPETFYVGWEQINNNSLYIGMDMNNDNSDKIFYNIGSNWVNTSYAGSLIIRPVFSTALNNTLNVNETINNDVNISFYPNPTQGQITIKGLNNNDTVEVMDLSGRIIETSSSKTINLHNFANGIYIINVYDVNNHKIYSDKLIKY